MRMNVGFRGHKLKVGFRGHKLKGGSTSLLEFGIVSGSKNRKYIRF